MKRFFLIPLLAFLCICSLTAAAKIYAAELTRAEALEYSEELLEVLQEDMAGCLAELIFQDIDKSKARIHDELLDFVKSNPQLSQKISPFLVRMITNQLITYIPTVKEQIRSEMEPFLANITPQISGVYNRQGKQWIVFRGEIATGGVVYWMFHCEKDENGEVQILQFENPSSGDSPVEIAITNMIEGIKIEWAKLADISYESPAAYATKITLATMNGDTDEIIDIYETHLLDTDSIYLPAAAAYTQALIENLLQGVDSDEYEVYIEKMDNHVKRVRRLAPEYVGIELLLVDYYFVSERFAEARDSVRKTRRIVGSDVYLDYLEGALYSLEGEHEKAAELLQRAKDQDLQDPAFLELYEAHSKEYPELY
ncbi:MAG: hypothetical protein IJD43_08080 [Thermoguttaceae bacterium]|nr:hypothetical protein [Thermoguttaceae bacterium]